MKKVLPFLLILSMLGCRSQKQPAVRYYTLEMPVAEIQSLNQEPPRFEYKCEIRNVEINPAFAGNRIASRQASNALIYYGYHEWATRPSEMLTQLTELLVRSEGMFSAVSSRSADFIPDYALHTFVHRLETIQSDKNIVAHLAVSFELMDVASNRVVSYHTVDREIPLEENTLNDFASVISSMYEDAVREMLQKVQRTLENN